MNYSDIMIAAAIAVVVIGIGLYVTQSVMIDSFPSENLCRQFNDPYNQTLFPDDQRGMNKIASIQHHCFKNESGWHLNESVPVVSG